MRSRIEVIILLQSIKLALSMSSFVLRKTMSVTEDLPTWLRLAILLDHYNVTGFIPVMVAAFVARQRLSIFADFSA